jgi:hypothetical protein
MIITLAFLLSEMVLVEVRGVYDAIACLGLEFECDLWILGQPHALLLPEGFRVSTRCRSDMSAFPISRILSTNDSYLLLSRMAWPGLVGW